MLNPFFLNGSKPEQGLIQDLINEQLRMYGVDVYYIPRIFKRENTIVREVIESEFTNSYPLEAYVSDYEGYGGQGTILSKFGLQDMDDVTLVISRERFETYITPLIKQIPNIKLPDRPKEGDLIWFPLGDRLFEIKFVEHEKPFYQLRENYVYELRCELYRDQSSEVLDTSLDFIDDNLQDRGYIQTLQMVGAAKTAEASTVIQNNGIQYIEVTDMGRGYKSQPTVAISSAPAGTGYPTFIVGGETGIGTAVLGRQIPEFCLARSDLSKVYRVDLIEPGYGYKETPLVSIQNGDPQSKAKAKAYLNNGIIGRITVTEPGSGYAIAPKVTIVGGGATVSASATSIINLKGEVEAVYVINAGAGHTSVPQVTIAPPLTFPDTTGTYKFNEVIVGSISSTTARVNRWNIVTSILEVKNLDGEFVNGEYIVGQESGARYGIRIINTDNLADKDDPNNKEDKFADNKEIQDEGNEIIVDNQENPFGIV